MKSLSKCVGAVALVALLAGSAAAAETLAMGKVKSVDTEKKQFILTDGADKEFTVQLAEDVVVNRGGKEGPSELKAGDAISICGDKGAQKWTAHYILVKEGDTKDSQLVLGAFKNYDADKKEFTFTDRQGKDWTHGMAEAKVRLNMQDSKIEDIKAGDNTLAIVDEVGGKMTLKAVMVQRSK
jgi:Cu/Ag efflux protein CusF